MIYQKRPYNSRILSMKFSLTDKILQDLGVVKTDVSYINGWFRLVLWNFQRYPSCNTPLYWIKLSWLWLWEKRETPRKQLELHPGSAHSVVHCPCKSAAATAASCQAENEKVSQAPIFTTKRLWPRRSPSCAFPLPGALAWSNLAEICGFSTKRSW